MSSYPALAFARFRGLDTPNPFTKNYVGDAWRVLHASYTQSARTYHNWAYVEVALTMREGLAPHAIRPDIVDHALLWGRANSGALGQDSYAHSDMQNATRNADLFKANSLLSEADKCAVAELIGVIAAPFDFPHTREPYVGFSTDRKLLADIIKLPYAVESTAFDEVECAIRQESPRVPESIYCAERAKILGDFAEHNPTFNIPDLEANHGPKARENLLRRASELRYLAAVF